MYIMKHHSFVQTLIRSRTFSLQLNYITQEVALSLICRLIFVLHHIFHRLFSNLMSVLSTLKNLWTGTCCLRSIFTDFMMFMLFSCRFAQFFISPLMKKDSMDREVKAVDSGNVIFRCVKIDSRRKLKFHVFQIW